MPKRLYLLRHAETRPAHNGDDRGRPLTAYGVDQCARLAQHAGDLLIDLVVHSPAVRTRATARLALAGRCGRLVEEEGLYNASAERLLLCFGQLDEGVESAALVGHNPGISDCALGLGGREPETLAGMMPCTFVTFTHDGAWRHLVFGACRLEGVFRP